MTVLMEYAYVWMVTSNKMENARKFVVVKHVRNGIFTIGIFFAILNIKISLKNNGSCFYDDELKIVCQCADSFTGLRCEVNMCDSLSCLNGGNCFYNASNCGGFPLQCICPYRFDGPLCERDICSEISCANEGKCIVDESDLSNLKPMCVCDTHITGETCEKIKPCGGDPCQNGGLCKIENHVNSSEQELLPFTLILLHVS